MQLLLVLLGFVNSKPHVSSGLTGIFQAKPLTSTGGFGSPTTSVRLASSASPHDANTSDALPWVNDLLIVFNEYDDWLKSQAEFSELA